MSPIPTRRVVATFALVAIAVVAAGAWWAASRGATDEDASMWQFARETGPESTALLSTWDGFAVEQAWSFVAEMGAVRGIYRGEIPSAPSELGFETEIPVRIRLEIQQPDMVHRLECLNGSSGEREEATPVGPVIVRSLEDGCQFILPSMAPPAEKYDGPRLHWQVLPLPPETPENWSLAFTARSGAR